MYFCVYVYVYADRWQSRCDVLSFSFVQNDISDVLDLTFSMDADEEKLILYEKAEVRPLPPFLSVSLLSLFG